MKKTLYILLILFLHLSFAKVSLAESKIANKIFGEKDCSQYSTKTFAGLNKYVRCKKGLEQSEGFIFSSKFTKKDKKKTYDPAKPCNEYSTKTFTGLADKMKCKKAKKN